MSANACKILRIPANAMSYFELSVIIYKLYQKSTNYYESFYVFVSYETSILTLTFECLLLFVNVEKLNFENDSYNKVMIFCKTETTNLRVQF